MATRPHLVFFVDDEDKILSSIRRSLADEDYEIHTFNDPVVAIEEVRRQRPSVVVSDYYMPAMKGPELLEQIWKIDETIGRAILTGKPDLVAVVRAVEQGAAHCFLIKPWDNDELREAVRNAILQHELLADRRVVKQEYAANEREERRQLLKLEAEMHVSRRKQGGGDSGSG